MASPRENDTMAKLVALCKRRGFIFQSSEIYEGINGFWDYGPYGVTMRRALEGLWWKYMVEDRENVVGLTPPLSATPVSGRPPAISTSSATP